MGKLYLLPLEAELNSPELDIHTGMKPYMMSDIPDSLHPERLHYRRPLDEDAGWAKRKLFAEHLLLVDSPDYFLALDPLFCFSAGKSDQLEGIRYTNTRGALVQGRIGGAVHFYTWLTENQAAFPGWVSPYVDERGVVPGEGMAKGFGADGYDWAMAGGEVNITPSPYFSLAGGHGKHHIGHGYRSMILSGFSYNYPYLKLMSSYGNFRYTNIYASLMDIREEMGLAQAPEYIKGKRKKSATFHSLSWLWDKRLELALTEAIIWEVKDSSWAFNPNYLNPVMGINTAQYGMNASINSLLGLSVKYKISESYQAYAQVVLDDNTKDKYALQLGAKAFSPLGIKGLYLQAEYNRASPYTYGHNDAAQNFGHYNMPLAHPLEAYFDEVLGRAVYTYKSWTALAQVNLCQFQGDTGFENYGHRIFLSDTARYITPEPGVQDPALQPKKHTLLYARAELMYTLNPVNRMQLFAGAQMRALRSELYDSDETYIYFGFRTGLFNRYFDF